MNLFSKVTAGAVIASSAVLITAGSAFATTVTQTQELNNSVKASMSCTGDCSSSVEATQNGKQTQTIEMPEVTRVVRGVAPSYRWKNGKNVVVWMPTTVAVMNEGQVRLNWGMRGVTCHVRYTETNSNIWKYNTSAGCDEGGVTISGLQPNVKYKFQVRQDNGAWSRAMVARAK